MGPRRPVRPTGSACLSLAAKSRFLRNRDAVGGYSVRMGYDEVLFSDATDRIDRLLSETFGIALSLHRSGMPMLCQRGKLGPSSLHLLMACFPISRKASEPQVAPLANMN